MTNPEKDITQKNGKKKLGHDCSKDKSTKEKGKGTMWKAK